MYIIYNLLSTEEETTLTEQIYIMLIFTYKGHSFISEEVHETGP